MTKEEIRRKYDRFAHWYDHVEGIFELFLLRRLRRDLLRRAAGRVLEIAVGTGKNLCYYPDGCRVTASDLSPAMLAIARKRAARLGVRATFAIMDGERLACPDRSFDAVVSSLTLCTFPDPLAALQEMARVCRTDGRILLLEHGRSSREWLGRWQDRRADRHARHLGCRWNREPLDLVHQAGLTLRSAQRTLLGIFHLLEVLPSGRPAPPRTPEATVQACTPSPRR